jgi:hypothetical protein
MLTVIAPAGPATPLPQNSQKQMHDFPSGRMRSSPAFYFSSFWGKIYRLAAFPQNLFLSDPNCLI